MYSFCLYLNVMMEPFRRIFLKRTFNKKLISVREKFIFFYKPHVMERIRSSYFHQTKHT